MEGENQGQLCETDMNGTVVHVKKVRAILKGYGEYPNKYRSLIWRNLLELPCNHTAFGALINKGTHSAFVKLQELYPIKSPTLLHTLQSVLSSIVHWSSLFAEVDYLPALVFPIVKFFQDNQLAAFEAVATILCNWCYDWFSYFPNPPYNVFGLIENILSYHDPHLLNHLVLHQISVQTYVWPLLSTLFSEVLSRDEWLQLMDNVLSNHPSFMVLVTVCYISAARQMLMKCTMPDDVHFFMQHPTTVNLNSVLHDAYRIQESIPSKLYPVKILRGFVPLTKGIYPMFDKYATFVVGYWLKERRRTVEEQQEQIKQKQNTFKHDKQAEQHQKKHKILLNQKSLVFETEKRPRTTTALQEKNM